MVFRDEGQDASIAIIKQTPIVYFATGKFQSLSPYETTTASSDGIGKHEGAKPNHEDHGGGASGVNQGIEHIRDIAAIMGQSFKLDWIDTAGVKFTQVA